MNRIKNLINFYYHRAHLVVVNFEYWIKRFFLIYLLDMMLKCSRCLQRKDSQHFSRQELNLLPKSIICFYCEDNELSGKELNERHALHLKSKNANLN